MLAENPQCQTALLDEGAVEPLILLGTYGHDAAKLKAIAALDLLALNNPMALERISEAGGAKLLRGLQKYGGSLMGEAAGGLLADISVAPETRKVAVDAKAHARQAHEARLRHSKVWRSAGGPPHGGVRRAVAPQPEESDAAEGYVED